MRASPGRRDGYRNDRRDFREPQDRPIDRNRYDRYGNSGKVDRYERGGRNERFDRDRRGHRPRAQTSDYDPDQHLNPQERLEKYKSRVESLKSVPLLSEIVIQNSQWGVRPKGFETVTAQRAKLSGQFPLPSENEGDEPAEVVLNADLLNSASRIDPADSRASRILLLRHIPRELHSRVVQLVEEFLKSADLERTSLTKNILDFWLTPAGNLAIEFINSTCATTALANSGEFEILGESSENAFERPREYVVQCLPPYSPSDHDIADVVADSPRKLVFHIQKHITESQFQSGLEKILKLRAMKLVREVGTKEPMGIVFVEFYIDSKLFPTQKSAIKQIMTLLDQARKLEFVRRAEFACIRVEGGQVRSTIQDCPLDIKNLKALVKNEYVQYHAKLRVVELINAVTEADIADYENYRFLQDDIRHEAGQFGKIVSMKIPQPPAKHGVGKIFIEFEDERSALSCIMNLAGRIYNDRVVLCAFFDYSDYQNELF